MCKHNDKKGYARRTLKQLKHLKHHLYVLLNSQSQVSAAEIPIVKMQRHAVHATCRSFLTRKFSGLRSRWITFIVWQWCTTLTIVRMTCTERTSMDAAQLHIFD